MGLPGVPITVWRHGDAQAPPSGGAAERPSLQRMRTTVMSLVRAEGLGTDPASSAQKGSGWETERSGTPTDCARGCGRSRPASPLACPDAVSALWPCACGPFASCSQGLGKALCRSTLRGALTPAFPAPFPTAALPAAAPLVLPRAFPSLWVQHLAHTSSMCKTGSPQFPLIPFLRLGMVCLRKRCQGVQTTDPILLRPLLSV